MRECLREAARVEVVDQLPQGGSLEFVLRRAVTGAT
jgi:hypothetical protein